MNYTKEQLRSICGRQTSASIPLPEAVRRVAQIMFILSDIDSGDANIIRSALSDLNIYGKFTFTADDSWREKRIAALKEELESLEEK